ncbi:hypothetical protein SDC9_66151 [bioreactor metagenome]|uniref:Cation efflux protein cytoplasmic domain-containing protein n=1 Tax=bioreactor metagenome TaxID=1076179 RepID=A0A644XU99_9ZZZZ
MQSAPQLDYEAIKGDSEGLPLVKSLYHVHAWMGDEKTIYFEAHIALADILLSEAETVYAEIEQLLTERYGISHITLQAETGKYADKSIFMP